VKEKSMIQTDGKSQLTVDTAYSQAIKHFNAGLISEADRLCTAIIQAVPNHIDSINLLGIIAQKVNRHDLAVKQFQLAIEIDNSRALLYFNLGTSLYPLGRREEAIHVLQLALEREPGNSQISDYLNGIMNAGVNNIQFNAEETLQRGISFHRSGQLDEAIRWYRKTLAIQPDNPAAFSNIGVALQAKGKLDEAVTSYQIAITIKPGFADVYSNLGSALQEQNKLDEAVANYQKAISINPDYAEAYYNLGTATKEQEKLDDAVPSKKKAFSINPN
jgi:superkiller protein 3